jgi:hypothetical protein
MESFACRVDLQIDAPSTYCSHRSGSPGLPDLGTEGRVTLGLGRSLMQGILQVPD